MPLTNFPNGVSSFGFPLVGSGPVITTGKVWFVNSATGQDANGKGTDPSRPFATVKFALGQVSATDVIFAMPGHTENITVAAGLNFNTVGVSLIGLGNGNNRPTFTYTTVASATVALAAANCMIQNCIFDASGVASVTNMFNVTADACSIVGCRIVLANATAQGLNGVILNAGGTNFSFLNNLVEADTAGAAQVIISGAAVAGLTVADNNIHGDFSAGIFKSASALHLTNMWITRNRLRQANGTAKAIFVFTTSSTGCVSNNTLEGTTWSTAADALGGATSTSLRWFQNFGFDDGAGAVSGVLVPAVGSIS